MTVATLKLPEQAKDEARLSLFWEAAQLLRHVVAELPDIGEGPRLRVRPVSGSSAYTVRRLKQGKLHASQCATAADTVRECLVA